MPSTWSASSDAVSPLSDLARTSCEAAGVVHSARHWQLAARRMLKKEEKMNNVLGNSTLCCPCFCYTGQQTKVQSARRNWSHALTTLRKGTGPNSWWRCVELWFQMGHGNQGALRLWFWTVKGVPTAHGCQGRLLKLKQRSLR